jgi:sRNA-binding protein
VPRVEVDTDILGTVARRLTDSVEVARQIRDDRDSLSAYADAAGHDQLREAIRSFLDRWAYGCGCLVEDANQVADRLGRTATVYAETEATIAEAASGGR